MMADIRMLQEQEQQIQSALTALTDAVKAMNTGVNARIDEQTETTRKALADQKTVTTSISTDLRALREKVDDVTTRLGQQAGEIQAVRQLITSRAPVAALAPAPDAGGGPAPDNSASAAPASPAAQGASPTAITTVRTETTPPASSTSPSTASRPSSTATPRTRRRLTRRRTSARRIFSGESSRKRSTPATPRFETTRRPASRPWPTIARASRSWS